MFLKWFNFRNCFLNFKKLSVQKYIPKLNHFREIMDLEHQLSAIIIGIDDQGYIEFLYDIV